MGPKEYPKASKWSLKGTQCRHDGNQINKMEPIQRYENDTKRAPKASKVELKVDQNHPNRANRASHGDQNGAQSEPMELIK